MRTNALYDGAWRDLQVAARSENIDRVIEAAERLAYAARSVKLDQQQNSEECNHVHIINGRCEDCGTLTQHDNQ